MQVWGGKQLVASTSNRLWIFWEVQTRRPNVAIPMTTKLSLIEDQDVSVGTEMRIVGKLERVPR